MLKDLPRPKVATVEQHRQYAAICNFGADRIFAALTSHILVLGAPPGESVLNSFHAGGTRSNLGKITKRFADAVVSLFDEGPHNLAQFPSQWPFLVAEYAQKHTFELQGFGPLFSFIFFHVVTAQAKYEESESRIRMLEKEIASLRGGKVLLAEEVQTDLAGDVVSIASLAADCTPQKPDGGTPVPLALSEMPVVEQDAMIDTSAVPMIGVGGSSLVPSSAYGRGGACEGVLAVHPPASSSKGRRVREDAIERMLQRKPQVLHRLEPVGRRHPHSEATVQQVRIGRPAAGNRSPRPGAACGVDQTLMRLAEGPSTDAVLRKSYTGSNRGACEEDKDESSPHIFQTTALNATVCSGMPAGTKAPPFTMVNGQPWKDFWAQKEKKKLQLKMGLAGPPADFSESDAANYGHQILKIKDEFLGTTAPLSARILRPVGLPPAQIEGGGRSSAEAPD
jgi:hypothetical protein